MVPYPLVSPTEEDLELRMLEEELGCATCKTYTPGTPGTARSAAAAKVETPQPILAPRGKSWLGQAMLEMSDTRPPRRTWEFLCAFGLEAFVVTLLVLLPLIYTEAIDLNQFTTTWLVAPPPPPPPPPPPAQGVFRAAKTVKRVFTSGGRLVAPTAIPQNIAMLKEEALPPDVIGGEGGVPGGVPGGHAGGVLGGILQEGRTGPVLTAPPIIRKAPVRVGGNIKRPLPVSTPPPVYPALARQARIQGSVEVRAIIDVDGNIVEAQVVSGHPLLLKAALDAVRNWKYQPTILNGEPVPIELIVTVNFRLSD
jgi:protein TonB